MSEQKFYHRYYYKAPSSVTKWWHDFCVAMFVESKKFLGENSAHVLTPDDLLIHYQSLPGFENFINSCSLKHEEILPRHERPYIAPDGDVWLEIAFYQDKKQKDQTTTYKDPVLFADLIRKKALNA